MEKIYDAQLFLLERFIIIILFFVGFLGNLWKLNLFWEFSSILIVLYNTVYFGSFFLDNNSEESGSCLDADSPGNKLLFDISVLEKVASIWDKRSAAYAFEVERLAMLIIVIFTLFPLMTTFEIVCKVLGVSLVILFSSTNTLYLSATFPEHLLQPVLHIQKSKKDEEHNDDDMIEKVKQDFETDGVTNEENIDNAENKETEFEEKCDYKLKEENMKLGLEIADLKSQLNVHKQMLSQIFNKCEKEKIDLSEKLGVAEASSQMYRTLLHDLGSSQF